MTEVVLTKVEAKKAACCALKYINPKKKPVSPVGLKPAFEGELSVRTKLLRRLGLITA